MKIETIAITTARICALACCALFGTAVLAADPAPRQELWVPTKDWESLIKKHPNAVMLNAEQYQALIRDSGKITPPKTDEKPLISALVESLHFKADARDESSEHLKLEGEMVVRCLTDEWTEVTTRMPFRNLASVTVDGGVVLGEPEAIKDDKTNASQRKLMVKGKGLHRIQIQVLGRPGTATLANTRNFAFQTTEVPAVMDLQLPAAAVVTQATASYSREGDVVHVLLHSTTPGLRDIAWTTSSAITEEARQSGGYGETTITDHSIETDWRINVERSTTDKSNQVVFDVIPPEAVVLSVEGEGITGWQQNAGRLNVTLRDRTHVLTLRSKVQSVLDLQAKPEAQSIAVPALRFAGRLAVDPNMRITGIAEGVTIMSYEGSAPTAAGILSWNPMRETLKMLLRKADPRIVADADAQVTVTRDDVQIKRTLQVNTDRTVNGLRVAIPEGEEFITTSSSGPAMDWKKVGQVIEYQWPNGLFGGSSNISLQSRKRLNNAPGGSAVSSLKIENLSIPEANKLAGYVALDFDPTWRVSVKSAAGLEERDARITPVQGKMAWFALRDFSLVFDVQRREPVFDAEITAYALPRARTVEIEGQIALDVSDAPLRQVKIAVSKDRAALLRFTSPLVGEQTLDAASGVWSLTLRKESMGRIPLRFRLSLPAEGKAGTENQSEKEDASVTIDAHLPTITASGVRRSRGVWVIEANTDTELTFAPQAMQPLDVLRAPAIEGYQPRHRVVAAFDYASSEASLTLHAARHGHSELASLLITSLHLTSVLSHDGSARHEFTLGVRHSGEQFINIQLPPGARLLTTLAANEPVKPVHGPEGAVSIPLPAGSANLPNVPVRVLYETSGESWTGSGNRHLVPPSLPGNVPILATDWEVYAPDGYSFKKVDTKLDQEGTGIVAASARMPNQAPIFPAAMPVRYTADLEIRSALRDESLTRRIPAAHEATMATLQKLKSTKIRELSLKGNSVNEALEAIRVATLDRDGGAPMPKIILQNHDVPSTAEVTLNLKDIPVEEALRYVTELAGMKYKVEGDRVIVQPITENASEMVTRVYKVPANFLSLHAGPTTGASPPQIKTARKILEDDGVPFPEGASAVFNAGSNQLVVMNTAPNLDMIKRYTLVEPSEVDIEGLGIAFSPRGEKSGLLPLEIAIPTAGRRLHFHGPLAPAPLTLNYVSGDRQITHALLFLLLGAGLFLAGGRQRPVLFTLLAVLVVVGGVSLVSEEWQPLGNAVLVGWLAALALVGAWRLAKRWDVWAKRAAVACVFMMFSGTLTHAADLPLPPDPAAHTVLIPFDETKPLSGAKPERYFLDRADFERLWSLAKENRKPEKIVDTDNDKPQAVLHSALYRAKIEEEHLAIEARFEVTTRGTWAKARLGVEQDAGKSLPLPLRDLIVDGKPGSLTNGEVLLEAPGHHLVQATFDLVQGRNWKQAALKLPPARAAKLSLTLANDDALPTFGNSSMVAVEEILNGKSVITLGLGSANQLKFDRVKKRPVSDALPPSAEITVTTSLSGEMRFHGVAKARMVFPGSARKSVAVVMDPEWTLDAAPMVSTAGHAVRDLRVSLLQEAGQQVLTTSFPHEVSDEVTLDFHLTPKGLNATHTPYVAPKATRWETTAQLLAQDGVKLIAKPTDAQRRLANEDYSYKGGDQMVSLPMIRCRLGNDDTLAIDSKPADAKTEANIDYVYQISEQKLELAAAIALKRERGGWNQLKIGLPAGMEIQSVQGPQIVAWEVQKQELFLLFDSRTGNEAKVVVHVANTVLKAAKNWTIEPLKLEGIQKTHGTAIIATHAATEARLEGFKRDHDLRETDPGTLTEVFTITLPLEKKLALEFDRSEWKANVSLRDLATRFSADAILLTQATNAGVLVSQQLGVIVEQGALRRLVVRLPKGLPEATVTGDQLRDVQSQIKGEMREYECSFQSQGGLLGRSAVTFDMQLPLTDAALAIPFVEVADVERLRRWFVIDNSSSRETKTLQSDGVDICAKDTLPYVPEVTTQPQFYQGRPNGGLKVAFTQLQATSANDAIVTLADITTVMRADGERWDTVVYSLSNRALQFLPVILPNRAELMAVSVSGEPVRADEETRKGARVRLIPLIQTKAGERSMEVRLVYRIKSNGLPKRLQLDDPDLVGLSAERTVWTASLPKGWTLADQSHEIFGNMEPIVEEGRDIEKLQSWMSDLGRINRAVSSSKDFKFNKEAIDEASKLNKQIEEVTKKIESKTKSRYSYDNDRNASKVEGDISRLKEEQGRQVLVLQDNQAAIPDAYVKSGTVNSNPTLQQGLTNTWALNGRAEQKPTAKTKDKEMADLNERYAQYQGLVREIEKKVGTKQDGIELPKLNEPAQRELEQQVAKVQQLGKDLQNSSNAMQSTLGLNDNVGLSKNFFGQPVWSSQPGMVQLNSSNTYTGATVITGGTLTLGGAGSVAGNLTGGWATAGETLRASSSNTSSNVNVGYDSRYEFNPFGANSNSLPSAGANTLSGAVTVNGGAALEYGYSGVLHDHSAHSFADTMGKVGDVQLTMNSLSGNVSGAAAMGNVETQASLNNASINAVASAPGSNLDAFGLNSNARASLNGGFGGLTVNGAIASGGVNFGAAAAKSAMDVAAALAPAPPAAPADPFASPKPAAAKRAKAVEVPRVKFTPVAPETKAVSQLRPTGRRSLEVEVPLTGEVWHFRKLKDHAVLDLNLRQDAAENKRSQTKFFGFGLLIWGLLAYVSSRHRKRVAVAV